MRDPVTMRVAQIRAELKERNIPFSDCFDKDGLVDRLRAARAGLVRPMEVRPPAAQNAVRPPPAVYDHVYDQDSDQVRSPAHPARVPAPPQ